MPLYQLESRRPVIHPGAYVSEHAVIIGDVEIEDGASVWPGVVIRGDNEKILIRRDANVQDGAIIHADPGFPVSIGTAVSIGHQAMLHGCMVHENCLVGIQAIVLNGAVIAANSLVGAGALVGEGKSYAERSLIIGSPAKVIRELTDEVISTIAANAIDYRDRGKLYATKLQPVT
ncbi:gamma carbonic anhydrase family protein [Caballeronia sp. S22]|uniref:gamma carbonic anhydrase family protein n=1 Tax=Caballeronia sp. S22 TaxID=3137182 RepID=UPI00353176C6